MGTSGIAATFHAPRKFVQLERVFRCLRQGARGPSRNAALRDAAAPRDLGLSETLIPKELDVVGGSAHPPIMHKCVDSPSTFALFDDA